MRLRTLPLAASGIICGSGLAWFDTSMEFDWPISLLALLTSSLLQVLSNLANDYGDFKKGTDNEERIGTPRALQLGMLSAKEMLRGIIVCGVLAFVSGCGLLLLAFGGNLNSVIFSFFILGLLSIAAAIKYTMGKFAYGYMGLGDVFVFIFFGPVAVMGTCYLCIGLLAFDAWMPAVALGCLSVGVLNTNNIRDMETDQKAGKVTLALKLGLRGARIYQVCLIMLAFSCLLAYSFRHFEFWYQHAWLLSLPLFMYNTVAVYMLPPSPDHNDLLKQLSLSTLLFSLLFLSGCVSS